MPDSLRRDQQFGTDAVGIYGHAPGLLPKPAPTESSGFRDSNVLLAPETHMIPAFALRQKLERNNKRCRGVFRTNISPCFRAPQTPNTSGMKIVEASSAPSVQAYLHQYQHPERKRWMQTHKQVVQANRISQNTAHTGYIRAAAPAQVAWKVPYVQGQRNVQPIGPYQSLAQRSILYRISDYLGSLGGNQ